MLDDNAAIEQRIVEQRSRFALDGDGLAAPLGDRIQIQDSRRRPGPFKLGEASDGSVGEMEPSRRPSEKLAMLMLFRPSTVPTCPITPGTS